MSPKILNAHTALLIIDVQKAIDHPIWGQRNNPNAEDNISRLLSTWRQRQWPIWHIKHNSQDPNSTYRSGQTGNEFKAEAQPLPDERIITKTTHSAFIGTNLETILKAEGHHTLVVSGVITNNSVEATVRHAADLGFEIFLIEDACFTFAKKDWNGHDRAADDVHAMTLANLHQEYCTVMTTQDVLGA